MRCGVSAPATVTPAARISARRWVTSSGLIGSAYSCLHPARRRAVRQRGDLGEQRLGVLVAGPEALEVEHAQAAELAEHDRRLRAHDGVHRGAQDRDVEAEGVDGPGGRHILRVARAPRGHDRDVVECVGPARALSAPELDLHGHPVSLPVGAWPPGSRGSSPRFVEARRRVELTRREGARAHRRPHPHREGTQCAPTLDTFAQLASLRHPRERTRAARRLGQGWEDRGMSERIPFVVVGGGVIGCRRSGC